jgi:hypothetical protein
VGGEGGSRELLLAPLLRSVSLNTESENVGCMMRSSVLEVVLTVMSAICQAVPLLTSLKRQRSRS